MSNAVLKVQNLNKKFCRHLKKSLIYGFQDLLWDFIGIKKSRSELRPKEFWALDGVSFEVNRGEAFAIVGSNGSGKSTLLRLIAGIFPPDTGSICYRGNLGALIALGAGFHPHLTGRENIYLNGAILGLTRKQIDQRINEIVTFAELKDFMEAPVSTYSSGMTVRLGFSIAVHCDANILLVDEVLAVGDTAFALKCYEKMLKFREAGGTLLLVSHNNQMIRNVCDRAIWLDHGKAKAYGDVHEVVDLYEKETMQRIAAGKKTDASEKIISRDAEIVIERVELFGSSAEAKDEFSVGEEMRVRLYYRASRKLENPIVILTVENIESIVVISNDSSHDGTRFQDVSNDGYFEFKLSRLSLKRGFYFVSFSLNEGDVSNVVSWGERIKKFSVYGGVVSHGIFNPFPEWNLQQKRM